MSDESHKSPGRPFPKGVSGNPGGREKGAKARAEAALEAREYTAADGVTYTGRDIAFHVLIDIMTDAKEKARDRTGAAVAMLDRVDGKPMQAVTLGGSVGLSPAQLAQAAALALTPAERVDELARLEAEDEAALAAGPPDSDSDSDG